VFECGIERKKRLYLLIISVYKELGWCYASFTFCFLHSLWYIHFLRADISLFLSYFYITAFWERHRAAWTCIRILFGGFASSYGL
jgi:hypothetical protein